MKDDANKMSEDSGGTAAKGPRGSSAPVVIGMVLFAVVVCGGAVWFVERRERTAEAAHSVEVTTTPKYIVHLEGFTVNLADAEETHFLRATIDLGIDRLPVGVEKEKLAQAVPVPRIRDSILSVLTVCKANDLLTPEGKAQLKKNIIEALNKNVPEIGVREIYFTEFLVQR